MTKQLQPIEPGEQGQRHRSSMSRRRFLRWGATGLLAAAALEKPWATWAAKKTSDSVHGRIVITGIEEHEIKPDYQDWLANEINHYQGPRSRIVYIVHTNKGFHGLGEGGQEPPEVLEKYIGSSPFDWIGNETSVPMGKAAGVPVYKSSSGSGTGAGCRREPGPWPATRRKWRTACNDTRHGDTLG